MLRPNRKRDILVGCCVIAALGICAQPTLAKKKSKKPTVTVATATATLTQSNQAANILATCPKGTVAVGGGVASAPNVVINGGDISGVALTASQRVGNTAWQSSVVLYDNMAATPPAARTVTAQAFCRSALKNPITTVFGAGTTAYRANGAPAAATCPAGTTLISGGFSTGSFIINPVETGSLVSESRRTSPTTWEAAGWSQTATAGTVTSFGYCLGGKQKGRPKLSELSGPAISLTGPANSNTSVNPPCPAKSPLVAGGFLVNGTSDGNAVIIGDAYSPAKDAWSASGLQGLGGSNTLATAAYCLSAGSGKNKRKK
jgi:hypothetical protein